LPRPLLPDIQFFDSESGSFGHIEFSSFATCWGDSVDIRYNVVDPAELLGQSGA
jgi:hypothetical protein